MRLISRINKSVKQLNGGGSGTGSQLFARMFKIIYKTSRCNVFCDHFFIEVFWLKAYSDHYEPEAQISNWIKVLYKTNSTPHDL